MNNKNRYLAKNDSFTLAQYDFNLETQQILFAMLYKINSNYIKPFEYKNSKGELELFEYNLDFNEIKELVGVDYHIENNKKVITRILKDLREKTVVFDTKDKTHIDGLIIQPVIDNIDKTMTFKISPRVKPLLNETFKRFTKFGFKHLSLCQSKYSFRLYEVLITKSKNTDKNLKIIKFSLEELRDILQIPLSYDFTKIKKLILEKSKLEYNAEDIENIEEKKEKVLFKSFKYSEITKKTRGRGRNAVSDIIFEFELLEETKLLMMSKAEKIQKELSSENWIMTKLRVLIENNKEREPYFNNLEINYVFGFISETIENIKKKYNIHGVLNQQVINNTLETAFNKFEKKYKNSSFEDFLKKGFDINIQFQLNKGENLQNSRD